MKKYYGIEVQHKDSATWHEWGRLYLTQSIAEEAKASIERDNIRLVNMGSKWRIFEMIRAE